jgi:hypothetical protein
VGAVFASLIAVAGTLLGSYSTYAFQRRTVVRGEIVARNERLRQERLAACRGFAAAVTELKRGVIASWFKRSGDAAALHEALAESDRLGAAAESAQFGMLLVTDDATVRALADAAFAAVGRIGEAADRAELRVREADFEAAVLAFITAAGRLLR